MIKLYILTLIALSLHALINQGGKPLALIVCMEIFSLLAVVERFSYLQSGFALTSISISFLLIFFIVLGATIGLVLLSTLSTSDKNTQKLFSY